MHSRIGGQISCRQQTLSRDNVQITNFYFDAESFKKKNKSRTTGKPEFVTEVE